MFLKFTFGPTYTQRFDGLCTNNFLYLVFPRFTCLPDPEAYYQIRWYLCEAQVLAYVEQVDCDPGERVREYLEPGDHRPLHVSCI